MFRIRTARNGYYYVQEQLGPCHWSRCSRFFYYRREAERFVDMNSKVRTKACGPRLCRCC